MRFKFVALLQDLVVIRASKEGLGRPSFAKWQALTCVLAVCLAMRHLSCACQPQSLTEITMSASDFTMNAVRETSVARLPYAIFNETANDRQARDECRNESQANTSLIYDSHHPHHALVVVVFYLAAGFD